MIKITPLRPPVSAKDAKEHDRIVGEMIRLRDKVEQIFTDVASWNENGRRPWEEPLDPDPTGEMRGILDHINASLSASWRG